MPPKNKYTNPKLRDEVKEDVQNSDKGGAPGQWSARKAQFMASEYKKRGGDYNTQKSEQDSSQKNLSKWSEEDWQTKEGSGSAKKEDGTQKRYLPKKAWEEMSDGEKKETDRKKQEESKRGQQFVQNTGKAKGARKKASEQEDAQYEAKKQEEKAGAKGSQGENEKAEEEEEEEEEKEEKPTRSRKRKSEPTKSGSNKKQKPDDSPQNEKSSKPDSNTKQDSKTKQGAKSDSRSKKTMGSKHDSADAPAKPASTDRLPKKGQSVTWKAMPGWVEGTVLEIAKKDGITEGKSYKATKNDPTVVLRAKSGKVCAQKVKSIYFD